MPQSPLIANGQLQLNTNGDLLSGDDILTQMETTLTSYNCIYNPAQNSQLYPYINSPENNTLMQDVLTSIIKSAYQILFQSGDITGLQIFIAATVLNYATIKINALDNNEQPITFSWSNA